MLRFCNIRPLAKTCTDRQVPAVGNLIKSSLNLNPTGGKCLKMQDIRHLTQYLSGR